MERRGALCREGMIQANAPPEIVVAVVIGFGRRAVAVVATVAVVPMVASAGVVNLMAMLVVSGVVLVVMHSYSPALIRYIVLYRIIHTVGF
jgi:hypothetical protein